MKGARSDRYGIRAYVKVGTSQRVKRFKHETPKRVIQAWIDETRVALRRLQPAKLHSGSFGADVARYLEQVSAMPTIDERRRHLQLWVNALGEKTERAGIEPSAIRQILNDWRTAGCEPATCNKRRTALMHVWTVLDGKGARNPVRDVPRFKVDDPLPRGKDPHAIDRKLLKAPRCRSRAVLRVLLWTGMRPVELERAQPDDLNRRARALIIRTAKGGRTRTIPLTPQALSAFGEFDAADCWLDEPDAKGRLTRIPSAAPLNKLLKKWTWMTLRVYDLRHSYGTALAARETRLDVIAELLGHSTLNLTRRYTLAAASESAKAATLKLAGRR